VHSGKGEHRGGHIKSYLSQKKKKNSEQQKKILLKIPQIIKTQSAKKIKMFRPNI
jgi:hypothetical protein